LSTASRLFAANAAFPRVDVLEPLSLLVDVGEAVTVFDAPTIAATSAPVGWPYAVALAG